MVTERQPQGGKRYNFPCESGPSHLGRELWGCILFGFDQNVRHWRDAEHLLAHSILEDSQFFDDVDAEKVNIKVVTYLKSSTHSLVFVFDGPCVEQIES